MLRISNLSYSYQTKNVFEDVNLILSAPEIVAVIGDNGAGKTTLLKLIAGELRPDDGVIKLNGEVGFLHQTQDDLDNKSGGEKMQIRLAEILRQYPQILLLDEPTNNLDAESKRWLLGDLKRYPGLVLMVSHDRDFINQVADKILYLHDGAVEVFPGNYVDFQGAMQQRRHLQELNYEHMQKERRKLQTQLHAAYNQAHKSNRRGYNKIDDESKLRYNGKRMGAQNSAGKILQATKSKLEHLTKVEKVKTQKIYSAEINPNLQHKRKLLMVTNLAKSYDRKRLFDGLDFEIWTGEKIRIIGRNGAGKSTLFRIIMGEEQADQGEIKVFEGVSIGYISQDLVGFDVKRSFTEQNGNLDKTTIYKAAMTMDLDPMTIEKPIQELSRGQQTKLMILKLILRPLDLVILDEITNHLDIRARENIERALRNYHGAIMLATHDESFAQAIKMEREIKL